MNANPISFFNALLIFFCLSLGMGIAQQEAESAKGHSLRLSFLLLHADYEGMDVFLVDSKKANRIGPIHVHGADFSDSVALPVGIYFMVLDPDLDSKKTPPLCEINLTEVKPRKLIVLLEPMGKRLKPHFVNPNDRKFKVNSTRFFNTTDVPIATDLGGAKAVVPAHDNVTVPPPVQGNLPYYQVSFFHPEPDGPPRRFVSTRWPFRAHGRYYTFFFVNPHTNGISYQTVEETVSHSSGD